jgi:nardilysin
MQLRCHTAREGHLLRKFGWGNRKSLVEDPAAAGVDVRGELLKYYR